MKLLLDTHAWLWFVLGDVSLTSVARAQIEDPSNAKWISAGSYWELAIKIRLGKYALPHPFDEFVRAAVEGQGFEVLPILPQHANALCTLPLHHRDPFDRLLVAQAMTEGMQLVSGDEILSNYGVKRVW